MNKELQALENIKREAGIPYFSTLYDIDMWREDFKTVETALKALEIIKKHRTHIAWGVFLNDLPEEEYQIIREVLNNGNFNNKN